jgi:hypothetical protein
VGIDEIIEFWEDLKKRDLIFENEPLNLMVEVIINSNPDLYEN